MGVPLYSYNSSNELTSNSTGNYTYDNNGNTLTDPSGKSYTWDFENRLKQVVVPGTGTVTFKYDPFGRRIQKSGPSGTTNYLYDGANVLEELDNGGSLLAKYTHDLGLDQPLAEVRSGATSYYEQDGIGSVTSLSNSAGVRSNTYTYDSYGKLTSSAGPIMNPYCYTGREFDSELGLYFYRQPPVRREMCVSAARAISRRVCSLCALSATSYTFGCFWMGRGSGASLANAR